MNKFKTKHYYIYYGDPNDLPVKEYNKKKVLSSDFIGLQESLGDNNYVFISDKNNKYQVFSYLCNLVIDLLCSKTLAGDKNDSDSLFSEIKYVFSRLNLVEDNKIKKILNAYQISWKEISELDKELSESETENIIRKNLSQIQI